MSSLLSLHLWAKRWLIFAYCSCWTFDFSACTSPCAVTAIQSRPSPADAAIPSHAPTSQTVNQHGGRHAALEHRIHRTLDGRRATTKMLRQHVRGRAGEM